MGVKETLLKAGKIAADVVLQTYLPGAKGFIQQAEDLLGPKTGAEKRVLAANMMASMLDTLAKSGKLEGSAPVLSEILAAVDQFVSAMKATGQLVESKTGTLTTGDETFQVIIVGKVQ